MSHLTKVTKMAPLPHRYRDRVNDTAIPYRLASPSHATAPLEASPDLKTERSLFSKDLQPPHGFGALSTGRDKPRGRNPRDGVHTFVSARAKAEKATTKLNTNDAINHPEFNAYYNFEGRKIDELTPLEKKTLEMAVHYPNIQNGTMKAPLYFRTRSFTRPQASQPDLVRQVFGTPELFNKIVGHIIPRSKDLTNLCATSQFFAGMVQSFWMHLDATKNDFLGWDMDSLVDVRRKEAQEEEERRERAKNRANGSQTVKGVQKRFFSPSVIISPVRPQDQGPSREVVVNKAGYPVTSSVKEYEETDFASSMTAHYKLLHLVYLNGHAIKHLILHSLPWVNVEALQRIIPEMAVLEALGVHQCFLLTLGDTQPFLHAINAINEERAKLNQPHIAADFTPFYYKGPPYKPDGTGHVGEYGIVPEEKDWLDSNKAVTALLLSIRDLCHKGSQDFFTPGTGFRSFLDRLPVRTMASILECIEAIHDYKTNKHHSGVGVPHGCRTGTYYPHGHNKLPLISEEMKYAMDVTLWQDLIVSCNGRPMLQKRLSDLIVLRGEFKLTHCVECKTDLPACFFMANVLARRAECVLCHGCQLAIYLSKHNWHLYKLRRDLAERVFRGKHSKELSVRKVLRNISKPARAGARARSGKEATPPRDAILSRPGMVDTDFHEEAEKLWEELTIQIPSQLRTTRAAIEIIDEMYDHLSYNDRVIKSAKREELQREELRLEYVLGTNQRDRDNGSLERPCRSWELNMRDYRAELALENGQFVNTAPIPIFNFESNIASMLGRSGGMPEYWKDNLEESDDKNIVAKNSHDCPNTTISSPASTTDKTQNKEPGFSSPKSNDWDEDSPVKPASHNSSATTLSINNGHWSAPSSQEDAILQTSSSPVTPKRPIPPGRDIYDQKTPQQSPSSPVYVAPTESTLPGQRLPVQPAQIIPFPGNTAQTVTQSPRHLLPHQRRGLQVSQPTQSTPQEKPLTYARVASSLDTPSHQETGSETPRLVPIVFPHDRPAQTVAQPPQRLLPHQRRGPQAAQSTKKTVTAPASQRLLPHQRREPQATQPTKKAIITPTSQSVPSHQQRPTRQVSASGTPQPIRNRILRITRTTPSTAASQSQNTTAPQRRSQGN
ncbi:hypothetical protein F4823DRAFT_375155 [Ustulina deusta]|nr:hypothetical protein F4823DRAFT_375155 [Ustulina deusta]